MTQDEALDLLKLGQNVYLTGPAGSGKTYLLNKYIDYLKKNKIEVGITASTGIAATHINGMTIHSWSGIGIKNRLNEHDIEELKKKLYLRTRIKSARVLIIDEISMLHGFRLDMVDIVCRALKDIDSPFGGLQIVMCGDFFQLPPVTRGPEEDGSFATSSQIWQQMDLKVCYLEEQYRQSDSGFLKVLNEIRGNKVTGDTVDLLMERYNAQIQGLENPTKLYTHNIDVDAINTLELAKIKADPEMFDMSSSGKKELVDLLTKSCLAPARLVLKIGAIVMFVKNNYDKGYVNGTLGEVIGFDESQYPIVKTVGGKKIIADPVNWAIEDEGTVKAQITQVPLRLAWAITVHKSQGMSLDAALIDLSKSFVEGMGYVALSRVRDLSGLKLVGINQMALKVNQEVLALDEILKNKSEKDRIMLASLSKKDKEKLQKEFVK